MQFYKKAQWKEFRKGIIELDGNTCSMCGRGENETILQVHHKRYISGRKPWEYPTSDCTVLCTGCHAAEHGLIMPKFGWEYLGEDDLGELSGTCEKCGSSIRYVFIIHHENWGTLEVGTYCCDNLTDSNIASNMIESVKSYESRKERFIYSKRWKSTNGIDQIIQGLFDIEVHNDETGYYLKIHELKSNKAYKDLHEAKSRAFEVIENGELVEYLKNHNIEFQSSSNKRAKK